MYIYVHVYIYLNQILTMLLKEEEGTSISSDVVEVGLGILQITSLKRCPQVWPCLDRSLFSTNFVEIDQVV